VSSRVARPHNLTVAELHTSYVLAGDQWVLVHDATKCERPPLGHIYRGGLYKNLRDACHRKQRPGTDINHMPARQALIEGLGLTESQAEQNGLAI
jgi:hypothetical protein